MMWMEGTGLVLRGPIPVKMVFHSDPLAQEGEVARNQEIGLGHRNIAIVNIFCIPLSLSIY